MDFTIDEIIQANYKQVFTMYKDEYGHPTQSMERVPGGVIISWMYSKEVIFIPISELVADRDLKRV